MGSKSKSSTSSTTNITTTTTNQNAIAGEGALSVIAGDGFQGDIGLTGFDAVQAIQSFNERAMQQDLLAAQNTANALALSGGGGGGSTPIFFPTNNSNQKDDDDNVVPTGENVQRLALVLGGVAAVATVVTLTRK